MSLRQGASSSDGMDNAANGQTASSSGASLRRPSACGGCKATGDETAQSKKFRVPPRVYVDNRTLICEVHDLSTLRRGDHGMTAINVVRSVSPTLDKLTSFLGSIELTYVYHHFTVMDDASYVGKDGIPRTSTGEVLKILEFSNTPGGFLENLSRETQGSWRSLPGAFLKLWMDKAQAMIVGFDEYGDTPNFYVVKESLDEDARRQVVRNALHLMEHQKPYHAFLNNCEHGANLIHNGVSKTPNGHFALVALLRSLLCCLSFFCLYDLAVSFESGAPLAGRIIADYVLFCIFAVFPVAVQAIVAYAMVFRTVQQARKDALIDHNDFWHLLIKELGRAIVGGAGAACLIAMMPRVVIYTQLRYFEIACAVCLTAYLLLDVMYSMLAHVAMRLIFFPLFGKVWLIEADDTASTPEKKVA